MALRRWTLHHVFLFCLFLDGYIQVFLGLGILNVILFLYLVCVRYRSPLLSFVLVVYHGGLHRDTWVSSNNSCFDEGPSEYRHSLTEEVSESDWVEPSETTNEHSLDVTENAPGVS
jgi:hypothetical protein